MQHPTQSQSFAHATSIDDKAVAGAGSIKSVYVYEAPVRIWHWINALAITVLAVTGYFIGSPLPSVPGEASANYLMGYIRFAHFAAGYLLLVGLIGRIYWAFVGNYHARELFTLPVLQPAYWREVKRMLVWYAFGPRPNRYVGHNPLARLAMFFGYFWLTLFMIATGFALYGEGAQAGSWSHRLFTSWVIPLFGSSQDVHTWHHLGLWAMVMFVTLHVYAALREDIMGRSSIISTMVSGHRTFKD